MISIFTMKITYFLIVVCFNLIRPGGEEVPLLDNLIDTLIGKFLVSRAPRTQATNH